MTAAGPAVRAAAAALALLLAGACGRQDAGRKAPPAPSHPAAAAPAWTWHPLGGLAVIEGEVQEPTELLLEGPSVRERRFAEPGPVRWELFRPPEGESAVLRTAAGRVLARFDFLTEPQARVVPVEPRPPARPRAVPPPPVQTASLRPAAPVPAPAPVPPPALARVPEPLARPVATRPGAGPLPPRPLPPRAAAPAWTPAVPAPLTRRPIPLPPVRVLPRPGTEPAWPGMGEALNLTRGPRDQKAMVLSFDGGSTAEVAAEVLDALKARGVRTTIFLTGQFIRRFPDLVRRMVAEGHEIGNHTMDHPHFAPGMRRDPAWTKARVQKELLDADAEMVRVTGRPMDPYWRAPYGEQTPEIRKWAEELGYRHVGWSEGADTLDWATTKTRRLYRTGPAILARLAQRMTRDGGGLIVLMHLGSERTEADRPAAGLGAFMDRAQAEGWHFVNVGTFLRGMGKPAWDPQHRLALLAGPRLQPGAGAR